MNKILYFDCFSGISGDMCLGSRLDLGVPCEYLTTELKKLSVDGYQLQTIPVQRKGIGAVKVEIVQTVRQEFRHLAAIEIIIKNSTLSGWVKDNSVNAFHKLATAEAKVHQTTIEKIHFHEVGALDSIIDIIGTFICIEYLKPAKIMASSVPLGSGFVKCSHGLLPVPTPATLELLKGVPTSSHLTDGELVTPTGAALLTTLTNTFTSFPAGTTEKIGYGAGTKDFEHPNVLRSVLIKRQQVELFKNDSSIVNDSIMVIETSIDDMTGESLGFLLDKLFQSGALDCYYTPIFMKKNRPGQKLTILFPQDKQQAILKSLFANSSTFGVRLSSQQRVKLSRRFQKVATPYGIIRLKLGYYLDQLMQVSPEFEDCASLAILNNISLDKVYQAAIKSYFNE